MNNTERDRETKWNTERDKENRETEQEAERIWTDTCLAFLKSMTNMNLSIFLSLLWLKPIVFTNFVWEWGIFFKKTSES